MAICRDRGHSLELGHTIDDISLFALHGGSHGLLRKHTCAILIPSRDPTRIGSGTVIRVRDQLLIATAGHVLENTSVEDVLLCSWYDEHPSRYPVPHSGIWGGGDWDVGFLRLHESVLAGSHIESLPLDRLMIGINHVPDHPVVICGAPAELVNSDSPLTELTYGYQAIAVRTIPTVEWSNLGVHDLRENRDILMHYSKTESWGPDRKPKPPVDPQGMSGGGIWLMPLHAEDNKIWNPSEARLIGLQVSMAGDSWSWLKGVQMQCWLKAVYDNCKDLRPDIESLVHRRAQ